MRSCFYIETIKINNILIFFSKLLLKNAQSWHFETNFKSEQTCPKRNRITFIIILENGKNIERALNNLTALFFEILKFRRQFLKPSRFYFSNMREIGIAFIKTP